MRTQSESWRHAGSTASIEPLETRRLMAADVALEWNAIVYSEMRGAKVAGCVMEREGHDEDRARGCDREERARDRDCDRRDRDDDGEGVTFCAAMGRGWVKVRAVPNATGTFSADIEVKLKGAAPNTTYTLQRAPEVGRPLGADGIFQRANGQFPWEQPSSPGFPPAPAFLTFVLPATATTPATPVTITTNGGGNGTVRFHFDAPIVPRGATFDVVFRAIDLAGVASEIRSDGFQVVPQ